MERRRKTLRPHPMRSQIVDVMRSYNKPISPTQLARITATSLGSVAYHVRTLTSAGIVELSDEGLVRGTVEHFYSLVRDDDHPQLNDDRVGQLLAFCGSLTVPGDGGGFPQPVVIDDAAREELRNMLDKLQPKVRAVALASTVRAG